MQENGFIPEVSGRARGLRGHFGRCSSAGARAIFGLLLTVVGNCHADGILGEDRAMQFDRRQVELLRYRAVLDLGRVIQGATLNQFRRERRRRYRRAAAEGLEASRLDDAIVADFDLQSHHVTASGGTHEAGANVGIVGVQGANVAGVVRMVDDFVAVQGSPIDESDGRRATH